VLQEPGQIVLRAELVRRFAFSSRSHWHVVLRNTTVPGTRLPRKGHFPSRCHEPVASLPLASWRVKVTM
jgi:hypothetical protein